MLKIVIADDEPVIIRGIQKLIDFENIGFSVVGEYEDGQSAFEGILKQEPDLALLDISMPLMDGIEILKQIHELSLKTKVILISGFQDFEYAKAALKYGAVEYLLKPVIKNELLKAIEKAFPVSVNLNDLGATDPWSDENNLEKIKKLENDGYTIACADVFFESGVYDKTKRLIQFSFRSFLEEYLSEHGLGIAFSKNEDIVLVLNGRTKDDIKKIVSDLRDECENKLGAKAFFVIGSSIEGMNEIADAYADCAAFMRYLFFADYIPGRLFFLCDLSDSSEKDSKDYESYSQKTVKAIIGKSKRDFELYYPRLVSVIYRLSDGKKEDACFYFCSFANKAYEKIALATGEDELAVMSELLSDARKCVSYLELAEEFKKKMASCMKGIGRKTGSEKQDPYACAIRYIGEHYMEDINLNVMADVVHMNPYYFSSFFKKKSGDNYKDYLSKVRIEKAMPYVISTDKAAYEIAMLVGFSDVRAFSDAFQRIYGETPKSYRKKLGK
ncbi:MAG: response regulator [Butyrivibrio sp.]|nr:response regulator [Butyrivibrio sp.]